jgi:hypothetical protein
MGITRQTVKAPVNKDHLPSGHEGSNVPSEPVGIPSCGFADVDRALTNLFRNDIRYVIGNIEGSPSNDPRDPKSAAAEGAITVKYASGERFALVKNQLHDKNGQIRLPMISLKRTGIEQSTEDITGRGINQQTGELVIRRKLAEKDKSYQSLINKLGVNPTVSRRGQGIFKGAPQIQQGGLLHPTIGDNIYEIITIPSPQFYTANYEVIFWAQKTNDLNEMLERTIKSYLMQGRNWKLTTPKGYWFIATTDESFQNQDNFDDFSDQEIIRKYTFNVKVKAYLIDGDDPDSPSPFRRYLSAPAISFAVSEEPSQGKVMEKTKGNDPYALSDPAIEAPTVTQEEIVETTTQPPRHLTMLGRDQKRGETVFYADSPEAFDIFSNK